MINAIAKTERRNLIGKKAIDVSIFEEEDLQDPNREWVRTKKGVYRGDRNMRDGIFEFASPTNSLQNLSFINGLMDMHYMVTGARAIPPNLGDRPTTAGVNLLQNKESERMQFMLRMVLTQAWPLLTEMICSNTIQFMDTPMVYSIVGSQYEQDLLHVFGDQRELMLNPEDVFASYSYLPLDPTIADQNLATMMSFIERFVSIPEIATGIAQQHNIGGILEEVYRRLGFNAAEWASAPPVNFTVGTPETVMQGLQSGNYEPIGGAANGV